MKDVKVKRSEIGEIKKLIKEVLEENDTLTIATSSDNCPWAATIVYVFDKDFNLYFTSEKDSRHVKELQKNPFVAMTVHDKTGKMKGLQIQGKASLVSKTKIPAALKLYWKRFSWAKDWIKSPKQLFLKTFTSAFYVVKPLKIYYLNRDLFGSETRKVLEF